MRCVSLCVLPLALVLASSCQGGGVVYDLNITPILPSNQDPFQDVDRLELTIEPSKGQSQTYTLNGVQGTPQITGLEAIEDARISVRGWAGETLVSFGRTESVSISEDSQTVEMLFAEVDTFAWLNTMPFEGAYTAAAPDGTGQYWVFGGADNSFDSRPEVYDTVARLSMAPPNATLSFETSAAVLPEFVGYVDEETYTGRVGHTATLLTGSAPNAGKILITGGSAGYTFLHTVTPQTLLFDPVAETFTELDELGVPRTNHVAVENQAGDVVLLGGLKFADEGYIEVTNTVEVYSRSSDSFTVLDGRLPADGYFGAGVSLGPDGVFYCGGATLSNPWKASADCVFVRNSYEIEDAAPMPAPLARFAMATTGEGKVLAVGGLSVQTADGVGLFDAVDAEAAAYLYDPANDEWTEVGEMAFARSHHVASSLPDGKVLIAGGAPSADLFQADQINGGGPALACVEVYSEAEGFQLLDDCEESDTTSTLPAAVTDPAIAYDPLYGVLLLGGVNEDSAGLTSAAFWVSTPAN